MIQLKANSELRAIFQRLIDIMKVKVEWNQVFVILNNNLILPGRVRSMFLNFDNKTLKTNIMDISMSKTGMIEMEDNTLLTNVLNMTLYAFGKWGVISGLKVDKDYKQLNQMFRNILKELDVEPSMEEGNFRFFKNGIQITYEDVIQEVVDAYKEEENDETEENQPENGIIEAEVSADGDDSDYHIGLWHNMMWEIENYSFKKETLENKSLVKTRLGHNFYQVNYNCPVCGEKLYMVLYPVGKELLIITKEARVYLARAYTCSSCNCFYTPRPGKVLQEGDIYILKFDEDKIAYEDYLELLGASGVRSANYKFNEYESDRYKVNKIPVESLENIYDHIDTMTKEQLEQLQDKMLSGFFPWEDVDRYSKAVDKQLTVKSRKEKTSGKQNKSKVKISDDEKELSEGDIEVSETNRRQHIKIDKNSNFSAKSIEELKRMVLGFSKDDYEEQVGYEIENALRKCLQEKVKAKYDAHMTVVSRMSKNQLADLKNKVQMEQEMGEEEKNQYVNRIEKAFYIREEEELEQKVKACREKPRVAVSKAIEEISQMDLPEHVKTPVLESLRELKREKGKAEVEKMIFHMPAKMNLKQYRLLREKIDQYSDVDLTPYEKQLNEQRDELETEEIEGRIAKAFKKDRNTMSGLYKQLQQENFMEHNVAPYLEKIHDKIYEMDERALEKICPDIMDLTFEEGIDIYDKIASGIYLPELKENMLNMLDKRLMKIKMDENTQLVRKLTKDMEENKVESKGLYLYDSRKMLNKADNEEQPDIIKQALDSYAAGRGKYEIPILISDSSRASNGKEGFVLTLEHIFYNSLLRSGIINIEDIDSITENSGILNKGVFVMHSNGSKIKMPTSLSKKGWEAFSNVLGEFIEYLQQKPESRNISYLAKEKHEIKCCYRCGYRYKGENICPKCGSKSNY